MEDITDSQLEMLRQRWERDPSPHLSLQLADLYRQRGEMESAIPILEQGLEAQPGRISIQVALGRYRLKAGDSSGAADMLRQVADADPGHLVANKLLVRAYLALGDRERARDRLALYTLLNDGDPELDGLRAAVEGASGLAVVEGGGEPFPAVAATEPTVADLAALAPPGSRRLVGALDHVPFLTLLQEPLEPADVSSVFIGILPVAEPMADGSSVAELTAIELMPAPPAVEQPVRPEGDTQIAEAVDRMLAAENLRPAPEPVELDGGAAATATLGALYLAQGHLDDARQTFEQVLARDPEDVEAIAGLEEVARRERPAEPVESQQPSRGLAGRRIERLRRYLGNLRTAADRLSA